MKSVISIAISSFLLLTLQTAPQERHALIIGINKFYEMPDQLNPHLTLSASVNDAKAVKGLLMWRFEFKKNEITELYDSIATRQNIMNQLNKLVKDSKKGDIVFIYYSGHGMQLQNSYSNKDDHHNEAIVASDLYDADPVIRDHKLNGIFNSLIRKKIVLTVVLDCCNSGTMDRAVQNDGWNPYIGEAASTDGNDFLKESYSTYLKALPFTNVDIKDTSRVQPSAEIPDSKFLLMSATDGKQLAGEITDENLMRHSIFTKALLTAFKNSGSVNPSVETIFRMINQEYNFQRVKGQTATLSADPSRLKMNLLGTRSSAFADAIIARCARFENERVILESGIFSGLGRGNLLRDLNIDQEITIKIIEFIGTDSAKGIVTKGDASLIKPGHKFKVINNQIQVDPVLKIYIPDDHISLTDFNRFIEKDIEPLLKGKDYWDYTHFRNEAPQIFSVNGKEWMDFVSGKKYKRFKDIKLYGPFIVFLPIPSFISSAIRSRLTNDPNILLTNDPSKADYTLICNYSKLSKAFFLTITNGLNSNGFFQFHILHTEIKKLPVSEAQLNLFAEEMRDLMLTLAIEHSGRWLIR